MIPAEAETVQHVFRRYAALASVRLLQQELAATGICTKSRISSTGRRWGGKPLARGALYHMLRNPIYCGRIVHKDQHYPGEHEAIIDEALWEEVQSRLAANTVERSIGETAANPSLLAGLLYDGQGDRMTPTHAVKKGMRYRYYVSRPLIGKTREASPEALRIAAAEIERIVLSSVGELIADPGRLSEALGHCIETAGEQQRMLKRAAELRQDARSARGEFAHRNRRALPTHYRVPRAHRYRDLGTRAVRVPARRARSGDAGFDAA